MGKIVKVTDRIQDIYLVNGDELRYDVEEFVNRDDFETEILERHIKDENIAQYAIENLDMITQYDLEFQLGDCDLNYYYDEEEIICAPLKHDSLFSINSDNLDVHDDWKLKEIMQLFINGSWAERDEIYKKVIG